MLPEEQTHLWDFLMLQIISLPPRAPESIPGGGARTSVFLLLFLFFNSAADSNVLPQLRTELRQVEQASAPGNLRKRHVHGADCEPQ